MTSSAIWVGVIVVIAAFVGLIFGTFRGIVFAVETLEKSILRNPKRWINAIENSKKNGKLDITKQMIKGNEIKEEELIQEVIDLIRAKNNEGGD